MRLSSSSFVRPVLALAALLAAACAGCEMGGDGDGWMTGPDNQQPTAPTEATIDADATLSADPGQGVGVFVEYGTGGHWHVFTSCDYATATNPGYACAFDVFATPLDASAAVSNAQGEALGLKDELTVGGDGALHLYAETTDGLNGVTFDAPPGVTIEIEAYLDGQADPHFIYWVGKGVIHSGAPSDPIDLVPSEAPASATGGTKK